MQCHSDGRVAAALCDEVKHLLDDTANRLLSDQLEENC